MISKKRHADGAVRIPTHELDDETCIKQVQALFPDICLTYLHHMIRLFNNNASAICTHLADLLENGGNYTRQRPPEAVEEEGEASVYDNEMQRMKQKYDTPERRAQPKTPSLIDQT
jgi:ABC-type cobalamin/Fe3+-siderophores transport system ATPase subunit